MPSKIYPGGLPDAAPVAWRNTGAAFIPARATPEAHAEAAYRKGLAEGESAGAQRAAVQLAPVLKNFAAIAAELAAARTRARLEAEESMVQLAIAIARRILQREIATDPEAILGLVRAACGRISARETHRIRLSSADAEIVRQNRTQLSIPDSVEIVADPSLAPGGALFDTTRGELDASAQTQLDEIQRGLTDLVRRRTQ